MKKKTWRGRPLGAADTEDLRRNLQNLPVEDYVVVKEELDSRELKLAISMTRVTAERKKFWIERYRYMLERMDKAGLAFWPKDPHGEDYGSDPNIETSPELMTRAEVSTALAELLKPDA